MGHALYQVSRPHGISRKHNGRRHVNSQRGVPGRAGTEPQRGSNRTPMPGAVTLSRTVWPTGRTGSDREDHISCQCPLLDQLMRADDLVQLHLHSIRDAPRPNLLAQRCPSRTSLDLRSGRVGVGVGVDPMKPQDAQCRAGCSRKKRAHCQSALRRRPPVVRWQTGSLSWLQHSTTLFYRHHGQGYSPPLAEQQRA